MQCQICQKETQDKYCTSCKHIRTTYVIHKLLEKIPITEKINKDTLIIKNLKNIEEYDLQLLEENKLLDKDKYNNYKWTNKENIEEYLKKHDKTNKKLKIKTENTKTKKEEKTLKTEDVIQLIEQKYNMTDTIDPDILQKQLKTNKKQTKKIIDNLTQEKLIKKSFYGQYKLNYHQIIKYKQEHNIKEDKIKTINKIKPATKKTTKTKNKKTTPKKKKKTKTQKTDITQKKITPQQLNKEDEIIPQLRKYITEELIILPRKIKQNDLTLKDLYTQYQQYSQNKIEETDFNKYFHQTINTYPHIRHNKKDKTIQYNIKSRNTPQILQQKIQKNSQKFKNNPNCKVKLKQNQLEIKTQIQKDEKAQLYNLLAYTQENMTEYNYKTTKKEIKIEITYDLTDEDPDLWLKFLKSYNIYNKK